MLSVLPSKGSPCSPSLAASASSGVIIFTIAFGLLLRYRGGNENKAYGCSSSLHARDYNFQGAATRLIENVHLIDKEELYLVEDLIVLLPIRDISNQRQSFSYQAERTSYG